MQSLSIIGLTGGRHIAAQQLFEQGPFQVLRCEDLAREHTLQTALQDSAHTLLIYCPPALALAHALKRDTEAACDQVLQNWSDQARTLLRHFMLNREHCTLVNELALLHPPNTALAALANKTCQAITAEAVISPEQTAQPLLEALGASLAYTDQNSASLYRDLETVADANGETAILQYRASLKKELQQIASEHATLIVVAEQHHEKSQELQELQEENKRLLLHLNQTKEALERSSSEHKELSKENNMRPQSVDVTEKTKELEEENELLLLQLHQVQEELEHYFCEYQKLTDPASRHSVATTHPTIATAGLALETLFDLRNEQIIGNNWYDAEQDGRWAGPGTNSTLNLPALGKGPFELVFDIVHALDVSIVKQMQILLNGEPLRLKYKFGKLPIKRFPCQVSATVESANGKPQASWNLELRFPKTLSPAGKDSDDHRQLAIRLKSIHARALVTPHKG
ncbi:hypothetical protein QWI17_15930 [Gilvimarinus sp. SDUM040013]|uniref:Uncharacterized protein n=1 Tax=Gilvimarinus gilvus TaxID=3058038 RepID=A0ABU4RVY9_9GAMM|nr:hypothetical protein [Gilvimarinus sp. SDUM040013]MDO3387331.1 hypothetical protein [Gilvimarinus sp. SDUM040013]MDX6849020.1 hypothetical protein [Gilvimarinus sp. SDUM040013]